MGRAPVHVIVEGNVCSVLQLQHMSRLVDPDKASDVRCCRRARRRSSVELLLINQILELEDLGIDEPDIKLVSCDSLSEFNDLILNKRITEAQVIKPSLERQKELNDELTELFEDIEDEVVHLAHGTSCGAVGGDQANPSRLEWLRLGWRPRKLCGGQLKRNCNTPCQNPACLCQCRGQCHLELQCATVAHCALMTALAAFNMAKAMWWFDYPLCNAQVFLGEIVCLASAQCCGERFV